MPTLMDAAGKDRFLTVRWNNALSIGLGLPALAFAAVALSVPAFSDRSAFIGLVAFGAVY